MEKNPQDYTEKSGGVIFHFQRTESFFSVFYARDFSSGVLYGCVIDFSASFLFISLAFH